MSLCTCGDVGLYKCPRCARPYCSLSCYKGPVHSQCSEAFYREQVEAELKQRSVSKEEQDKMLKLLQREQCLSSDDEEVDLAELMKDVDIKSETELWGMLTESEQQAFIKSLKSGSITTLLKPKENWWTKESLVYRPTKTRKFENLCSKEPSVNMKYLLLRVILSYVHMEMIYPHKEELLSEYWAMFSRLWDWESLTIYTTAEATCIAYTDTANTAGLQEFLPIRSVFENSSKLLAHGQLAAERVCCELYKVLGKVHKISPLPKCDYTKIRKKLQYLASWSLSEHGTVLPALVLELEFYITKLGSDVRKFAEDLNKPGGEIAGKSSKPLIEELPS